MKGGGKKTKSRSWPPLLSIELQLLSSAVGFEHSGEQHTIIVLMMRAGFVLVMIINYDHYDNDDQNDDTMFDQL